MKKFQLLLFSFFICFSVFANAKGTLQIETNITDAFIYIDNKKKAMIGEGFTELYLEEGEYHIEIRKKSSDNNIYIGSKSVFVGNDTKTRININTKKIQKVRKAKIQKLSNYDKSKELSKIKKDYYTNINNANYTDSYQMHTVMNRVKLSLSKYNEYWKKNIKHVQILHIKILDSNMKKNIAKYKYNIAYTRADNTVFCNEETISYVYVNKWYIDNIKTKKCTSTEYTSFSAYGKIKVLVPTYYKKGESIEVKVIMKPYRDLKKGGITVSFFDKRYLKIENKDSTFETISHYKPKTKIWNKDLKQNIPITYDVFEGWTNNWKDKQTQVLNFTFKPKKYVNFMLNVRAIQIDDKKKEYPTPTFGFKDEQGYNAMYVFVPILDTK